MQPKNLVELHHECMYVCVFAMERENGGDTKEMEEEGGAQRCRGGGQPGPFQTICLPLQQRSPLTSRRLPLISHHAASRNNPRCVYLEKQEKIVCIIRSATRAALRWSSASAEDHGLHPAPLEGAVWGLPRTTETSLDGLQGLDGPHMLFAPSCCLHRPTLFSSLPCGERC